MKRWQKQKNLVILPILPILIIRKCCTRLAHAPLHCYQDEEDRKEEQKDKLEMIDSVHAAYDSLSSYCSDLMKRYEARIADLKLQSEKSVVMINGKPQHKYY